MQSSVSGKNQISIPPTIARRHGIRPGCRLEWRETDDPEVLQVRVIPDPETLAEQLLGAGKRYLTSGEDPIAELERQRADEDTE